MTGLDLEPGRLCGGSCGVEVAGMEAGDRTCVWGRTGLMAGRVAGAGLEDEVVTGERTEMVVGWLWTNEELLPILLVSCYPLAFQ